ncbi:hypothetical protein MSAN_02035200 [Mycena sanguinolenta]|uniref:Uncharacterized protein n=1 Tax=Mycena sanguinolenta TaxID=230812 RepID=A0A8H7CNJ3_9AGAR|nr:hypothetical protein MSAN_02035200 [Mycena sanguinolenta]
MPPRRAKTTFEAALAVSRQIDDMQEESSRLRRTAREVLILGTPGSGKTTLMRQMKAIDSPYTDAEREVFKSSVHASLIHALRILFSIVPDDSLTPRILEYRQTILSANVMPATAQESAHFIHEWWSGYDPIQRLKLEKSTLHFLDRIIPIIAGELPSDLDILFCTVDSPAIEELHIELNSFVNCSLNYVCPRQSLRSAHKWLPMFADTDNVMFVLNLNDYDHPENMKMAQYFHTAEQTPLLRHQACDPRCAIQFLLRRFRRFCPEDYRYITHWVLDLTEVDTFRVTMRALVDAFQPRPITRNLM